MGKIKKMTAIFTFSEFHEIIALHNFLTVKVFLIFVEPNNNEHSGDLFCLVTLKTSASSFQLFFS